MNMLGVSYRVMGGSSHCCGIIAGNTDTAARFASNTIGKLGQPGSRVPQPVRRNPF
jgi:hypothetical protein